MFNSGFLILPIFLNLCFLDVDNKEWLGLIQPNTYRYAIRESVLRMDLAGSDISDYFTKMINECNGSTFSTQADRETVRDIKEKFGYIAADFKQELTSSNSALQKTYELPDGTKCTIGSERFRCPEAMFKPSLLGLEILGVHEMIFKSINTCGTDVRKDLYANILFSGGNTMFNGFANRIQTEIAALAPNNTKIKIIAPAERRYLNWIGGSILANLSTFEHLQMTMKEYRESGPSLIHSKWL